MGGYRCLGAWIQTRVLPDTDPAGTGGYRVPDTAGYRSFYIGIQAYPLVGLQGRIQDTGTLCIPVYTRCMPSAISMHRAHVQLCLDEGIRNGSLRLQGFGFIV